MNKAVWGLWTMSLWAACVVSYAAPVSDEPNAPASSASPVFSEVDHLLTQAEQMVREVEALEPARQKVMADKALAQAALAQAASTKAAAARMASIQAAKATAAAAETTAAQVAAEKTLAAQKAAADAARVQAAAAEAAMAVAGTQLISAQQAEQAALVKAVPARKAAANATLVKATAARAAAAQAAAAEALAKQANLEASCRKTISLDSMLRGNLPVYGPQVRSTGHDTAASWSVSLREYYACMAVAERNAQRCAPLKSLKLTGRGQAVPPSEEPVFDCNKKQLSENMLRALVIHGPDARDAVLRFLRYKATSDKSSVPDPEMERVALKMSRYSSDPVKSCEGIPPNADKKSLSCESLVRILNGQEGCDKNPGWSCLDVVGFRKAYAAKNPALCGGGAFCLAMLSGDAQSCAPLADAAKREYCVASHPRTVPSSPAAAPEQSAAALAAAQTDEVQASAIIAAAQTATAQAASKAAALRAATTKAVAAKAAAAQALSKAAAAHAAAVVAQAAQTAAAKAAAAQVAASHAAEAQSVAAQMAAKAAAAQVAAAQVPATVPVEREKALNSALDEAHSRLLQIDEVTAGDHLPTMTKEIDHREERIAELRERFSRLKNKLMPIKTAVPSNVKKT